MTEPVGAWSPKRVPAKTKAYHYTTPIGLLGIISSGSLWASDASSLNDLSEVIQGRKFTRRRIKNRLKGDGPDEVLSRLVEVSSKKHMWHRPRGEFFITCASLEPDDAAQWRLYTGARGGYALHIDVAQPLDVQLTPEQASALPHSWNALLNTASVEGWYYVAYERKEKERLVDDLIDWARRRWDEAEDQFVRRAHGEWEDDLGAEISFDRDSDFAAAVDLASALMKPKGFRAEREVRTIATLVSSHRHVQYRATDEMVSRYVRLASASTSSERGGRSSRASSSSLSQPRKLPITGVTVGINGVYDDVEQTTVSLLERNGYGKLPVNSSRVPMRW